MKVNRIIGGLFAVAAIALAGCANNQQGYQKAFNEQHSLTHNQGTFTQSSEVIFKIAKQTFIQQGFTVESADSKSGIIKAVRNMQDKEDGEISYNIHASADISEIAQHNTNVSLSASQQTILHRATTTWWHLLWILPVIPTGTEYQTLVIKEGNITDPGFYTDFFNSMNVSVAKYETAVKAAAAIAAEKAESERIAAEKAARIKAEADAKVAAERESKIRAETEARVAAEKLEEARLAGEKALAEQNAEKSAVDAQLARAAEIRKAEEDATAIVSGDGKKGKQVKKNK
jgi:hypothetical protein